MFLVKSVFPKQQKACQNINCTVKLKTDSWFKKEYEIILNTYDPQML